MSNMTALDITEIEQQQRRVMKGLDRMRDDEVDSHRKTFLRIATPSRTHLDSGDIGYFHARIKDAEKVAEIREVLSTYFNRLINDEKHLRKDGNQLLNVVDYSSGSSGDGTHYRDIAVEIISGNRIRVSNSYENHVLDTELEPQEFIRFFQDSALPYAYYYKDFITAAQANPETAVLLKQAETEKSRPARDAARISKQQALRNHLRKRR
ncbi:MAG: hypothetical protein EP349_02175 [Alphaproteobacteria bacterium]|nr:MAG: hypothetical protein EP349_02175 [Alphaproteobacteria bacterium]